MALQCRPRPPCAFAQHYMLAAMAIYRGVEIPDNDDERVGALKSYGIVGTPPEVDYDDIVELAAQITECRISYISFFDETLSRLKARYGIPLHRPDRPRELSLCAPTICQNDLIVIHDLSANPRYADLPAVVNPPHARFYCAMPLINSDGYALGTLCVWDPEPKTISPEQQQAMRRLARQVMGKLEIRRAITVLKERIAELEDGARQARTELATQRDLLAHVLPAQVAEQLLAGVSPQPRYFSNATVVFVDFADFSTLSESLAPRDLIEQLDEYFSVFDAIVSEHDVVKIKTVGDAYLAVAGIIHERPDHARRACQAALDILVAMATANGARRKLGLPEWRIRTGIHSGAVIAGQIGQSCATYDVWGDGVNVAKRLQEACEPGHICISDSTLGLISKHFETERRGAIDAKHKGQIEMHYLLSAIA